jgi:hypothetical protein
MVMTQVTVTEAELGQVIAMDAMLNEIIMETAPTEYRSYFTLVDEDQGFELSIFNIDPTTSHVGAGTILMSGGAISFKNLTLKSIPAGSSFQIDYGPPPTLSSLSPNTAVAGTDPDFVLSCIGTDFTSGSVIYFGAEDEPTTLVSDTEVTTIVKPAMFVPDIVPVKIRTGTLYSDPIDFTFTASAASE